MTAGVPGTGVGGLFYLIAALLLPLRGLVLRARGTRVPWETIRRQLELAIGVSLGLWAMGWLLGFILGPKGTADAATQSGLSALPQVQSALRWAALLVGTATLGFVLLLVQLARFVLRRRPA
jgi:hypothetical protein